MIVRLIDKKGFTKIVEHPCGKMNIGISFPVKLEPSDDPKMILKTIDFIWSHYTDFDGNPIFEEVE